MEPRAKKIVLEASSVEDAIRRISSELGVPETRLQASILSEGKSFFGLFGKKLQVEITVKEEPEVSDSGSVCDEQLTKECVDFLEELLGKMGLEVEPRVNSNNVISLEGMDSAIILGRHGDTLRGLEYIANLCLRETKDVPRIRLDSDGYRERRESSLVRLAASSARKAVERGTPVRLDPMASWERRIIHIALKNHNDVSTESVGESPERKVVILPKVDPHDTGAKNKRRRRK